MITTMNVRFLVDSKDKPLNFVYVPTGKRRRTEGSFSVPSSNTILDPPEPRNFVYVPTGKRRRTEGSFSAPPSNTVTDSDDDLGGFDPEEENEPVTDSDDDLGGFDPEEEENEPVVVAADPDPVPDVPGPPPPTAPQVLRRSARIRSLKGSIPIRKSLRLLAKSRVD